MFTGREPGGPQGPSGSTVPLSLSAIGRQALSSASPELTSHSSIPACPGNIRSFSEPQFLIWTRRIRTTAQSGHDPSMTSGSMPGTQGSHKGLLSSRKHSREKPAPLDSAARPMVTGAPVVTDEAVAKAGSLSGPWFPHL